MKPLNSYQRLLRTRKHSAERGRLMLEYAEEKGISPRMAWRRVYHMREQLDEAGDLVRKDRADKGKPRDGIYQPEAIKNVKALLRDRERSLKSVAADCGVSYHLVRLISRGQL